MKVTARFARRFFWRRAHSRQRRRNCLSPRVSGGSSITLMLHNRSPNSCGSLSDRALRPWPEAAVLLIVFVVVLRSSRRTTAQSNAARFPGLNVPRFAATAGPPCVLALPKTLFGRLRCCSKLIAAVGARPCWAGQPCWRYLALCRLQAPKISLCQILHRRRKRLKSRRHLRRLLRRQRCRRHQHRHRRRRPRRHRRLHRK